MSLLPEIEWSDIRYQQVVRSLENSGTMDDSISLGAQQSGFGSFLAKVTFKLPSKV